MTDEQQFIQKHNLTMKWYRAEYQRKKDEFRKFLTDHPGQQFETFAIFHDQYQEEMMKREKKQNEEDDAFAKEIQDSIEIPERKLEAIVQESQMEIENPERVKEIKKQSLLLEKDELLEEYKQKCLSFFEENSYGLPWIQISNWANLDNEISGIQKLISDKTIQTIDELRACMSDHSRNMIDNWIKVIGKFYLKKPRTYHSCQTGSGSLGAC